MNIITQKHCGGCEQWLKLSSFNKHKGRKDGLATVCRNCANASNRKYRRDHPLTEKEKVKLRPYFREKTRKYTLEKRTLVMAYAAKMGCIDCGEKDPVVLEFDHVRGEKIERISKLLSNGASIDILRTEIAKCEVRCANCHRKRTAIQLNRYQYIDFNTLKDIDLSPLLTK